MDAATLVPLVRASSFFRSLSSESSLLRHPPVQAAGQPAGQSSGQPAGQPNDLCCSTQVARLQAALRVEAEASALVANEDCHFCGESSCFCTNDEICIS